MNLINLLIGKWDIILFVIALITGIIVLYRRGEMGLLKSIVFSLVIEAERVYGNGTGELKKAAVLEWLYDKIPALLTILISQETFERMIENVLEYAKVEWTANLDHSQQSSITHSPRA